MAINRIVTSSVLFSTEQIKQINKEIQKYIIDEGREPFDQIAEGKVKKAKVNYLPCPPLMEYLYPFISFIQGTNVKHFGYDIFFYLGTDQFNYNVYDGKTKDEINEKLDEMKSSLKKPILSEIIPQVPLGVSSIRGKIKSSLHS